MLQDCREVYPRTWRVCFKVRFFRLEQGVLQNKRRVKSVKTSVKRPFLPDPFNIVSDISELLSAFDDAPICVDSDLKIEKLLIAWDDTSRFSTGWRAKYCSHVFAKKVSFASGVTKSLSRAQLGWICWPPEENETPINCESLNKNGRGTNTYWMFHFYSQLWLNYLAFIVFELSNRFSHIFLTS